MPSLRTRTLTAALVLVAVVISATLLLSREVVVSKFDAFVQRGQSRAAGEALAEVQTFVDRTGSLQGVDTMLDQIHQRTKALLVILHDGKAIAASPAEPTTILLTPSGVMLTIAADGEHSEFALAGSLPAIVGSRGETLASLIVLPAPRGERREFNGEVNRGLWWIAAGIGLVGVLLSGWAAGRLVKPVEQLTAAAQRLSAGDLSQRVLVHRTDEIGLLTSAFNSMAEALERNGSTTRFATRHRAPWSQSKARSSITHASGSPWQTRALGSPTISCPSCSTGSFARTTHAIDARAAPVSAWPSSSSWSRCKAVPLTRRTGRAVAFASP